MNKVMIGGYIGRDAETKFTQGGKAVSNFSVATSYKPKNGEAKTEWHKCVVWDKEKLAEYLTKGKFVVVEGRLQTRSYDKDGETRYSTEIVVEQVTFGGGKSGESSKREAEDQGAITDTGFGDDQDVPF